MSVSNQNIKHSTRSNLNALQLMLSFFILQKCFCECLLWQCDIIVLQAEQSPLSILHTSWEVDALFSGSWWVGVHHMLGRWQLNLRRLLLYFLFSTAGKTVLLANWGRYYTNGEQGLKY